MDRYRLPDLPYDPGALEPHLSGRLIELHHGEHHAAYVKGANAVLERLEEARQERDFGNVGALTRALAFNVSGHVLHSIYWKNLSPDGGGHPEGELAAALDRDFGSFELFREQLTAVAATVMGSGWAALVYEPCTQRLLTVQLHDHQSETAQGSVPLMLIDAWEHAWYLQYQTDKASYFDALWNLWNWSDVAARLEAARRLELRAGVEGEAAAGVPLAH